MKSTVKVTRTLSFTMEIFLCVCDCSLLPTLNCYSNGHFRAPFNVLFHNDFY